MRQLGGCLTGVALAAMAAAGTLAAPPAAHAKNGVNAAIAGALIGAAVGAAVSESQRQPRQIIVDDNDYAPVYRGGRYASYSPKPGVICYPVQQACYKANGTFAANASWQEFGR
jgi:hypothetical protein